MTSRLGCGLTRLNGSGQNEHPHRSSRYSVSGIDGYRGGSMEGIGMDRKLRFNDVKTITYDAASLGIPDGYRFPEPVTEQMTLPLAKVCVKWKPSRHSSTSVETRWIAPADLPEAYKELGRAIAIAGYTEPQWWQYWRWGEHKPRPEIIKAYREFLLTPPSSPPTPAPPDSQS